VLVGALDDLVTEFARLPGIGRKTAQRLAFHLVQQPAERIARLAQALVAVAERVRPCEECGNLAEGERCELCLDPRRDAGLICVVEEPSAVSILERSGEYRGRYHVLGGRIDPLAGLGPEALRLDRLVARVAAGGVREVILATNPSMEGEVTATYVQQLLAGRGVRVTRLARGLPMGGDLEYVDGVTLAHALSARQEVG
jgi:recombination protein RecR